MLALKMEGNFEKILGVLSDDLLNDIPLYVWDDVMFYIMNVMKERVKEIQRKRVKKTTKKWRKWAAQAGYQVETYKGTFSPVLAGSMAGMRTGTLMGDLEFSREPTVIREIFRSKGGSSLVYGIDADVYSRSYPIIFSDWVEKVKGVTAGLGIPEENIVIALERLGESVLRIMSERWSKA